MTPMQYQEDAIAFHLERKYSINAFNMGLGKTFTALTAAHRTTLKTLVICPAYLVNTWKAEIEKAGMDKKQFLICSYSKIKKYYSTNRNSKIGFVIIDECHYLKNPETIRSKYTERFIRLDKPEYVLMLSGTPAKNNVGEYYNLLRVLNSGKKIEGFKFNNYFSFQYAFMNAANKPFGRNGSNIVVFSGAKNQDRLKKMLDQVLVLKHKGEVDLPPQVDIMKIGDVTKFDKELKQQFKNITDKTSYMTIKANAAQATTKHTKLVLEDIVDQGDQVIVFTEHVDAALDLAEEFCVQPITGKVSAEKRDAIVQKFKDGIDKVLVATYKTAGTGFTITNCKYMVFNDLSYSPSDVEQAKKRIHRIGQTETCYYIYMYVSRYFKQIQDKLVAKMSNLKSVGLEEFEPRIKVRF